MDAKILKRHFAPKRTSILRRIITEIILSHDQPDEYEFERGGRGKKT